MSESNNNVPIPITQLQEAKGYVSGMYYPVAKAGYGTKKIPVEYTMNVLSALQSFNERNIFTLAGATEGYYMGINGNAIPNPNTGYTDYIDISLYGDSLKFYALNTTSVTAYQGAFYNEEKEYISGYYTVATNQEETIKIPYNAKYIVFSFALINKDTQYMKVTTKEKTLLSPFAIHNIFNTENSIVGKYAKQDDGTLVSNPTVGVTGFLNLGGAKTIHINKPSAMTHQGAFYDKNFLYVSGYVFGSTDPNGEKIVTIPQNAKYIRISYVLSDVNLYYAYIDFEEIKQVSRLKNYKINCLGDSITFGYIPDNGAQMIAPYPFQLPDLLKCNTVRNYGISGSTLAVNSGNYDPMCIRYATMDNDANIILLFGGTNDYGRGVYTPTLGTINDTVNTTIYGALNIISEGLINKYPRAFIFYMTPMRRADKTGPNGGGYTLEQVSNAIKEVAYKYNIPVLDLYSKGGFHVENADFRAIYSGNDKLHPSQAFVSEHLAPMIARFIESNI